MHMLLGFGLVKRKLISYLIDDHIAGKYKGMDSLESRATVARHKVIFPSRGNRYTRREATSRIAAWIVVISLCSFIIWLLGFP